MKLKEILLGLEGLKAKGNLDIDIKGIEKNSKEIKEMLEEKLEALNEIPLFVTYNQNLEVVNQKLQMIQEEFNDYFDSKLNKSI